MSDAPLPPGLPDIAATGLTVLFCGINPGLLSASSGHHFARPGNRFWKALFAAGITDRLLDPSEQMELLHYGVGITNMVARPSAAASEISKEELRQGGQLLEARVRRLVPRVVAVLGMQAYRVAFGEPKAQIGPQANAWGPSRLWLLPNPSGLQARYQLPEMAQLMGDMWQDAVSER